LTLSSTLKGWGFTQRGEIGLMMVAAMQTEALDLLAEEML
jgi:hypothetical protein